MNETKSGQECPHTAGRDACLGKIILRGHQETNRNSNSLLVAGI
jgi:hypothetical protein